MKAGALGLAVGLNAAEEKEEAVEEPASSLASCSSGAPCSLRWSATARRDRNTRIPGLKEGGSKSKFRPKKGIPEELAVNPPVFSLALVPLDPPSRRQAQIALLPGFSHLQVKSLGNC